MPDPRSDFGEVESFQEALEFYRPIWSRDEEILRRVNPEDGGIYFSKSKSSGRGRLHETEVGRVGLLLKKYSFYFVLCGKFAIFA